jgi:hypothetical protein
MISVQALMLVRCCGCRHLLKQTNQSEKYSLGDNLFFITTQVSSEFQRAFPLAHLFTSIQLYSSVSLLH